MLIHLCIVWLFCATMAELSNCDRPYGLRTLKYLLSDLLQKKFANPGLGEHFNVWSGFMICAAFTLFSFQKLKDFPFLSQVFLKLKHPWFLY